MKNKKIIFQIGIITVAAFLFWIGIKHYIKIRYQNNGDAKQSYVFISKKKANIRTGPGFHYPVKTIFYDAFYMPLLIDFKIDDWIKTRDWESNIGWIHASVITKKKSYVMTTEPGIIYAKETPDNNFKIATVSKNAILLKLQDSNEYVKVKKGKIKGFIKKTIVFGS